MVLCADFLLAFRKACHGSECPKLGMDWSHVRSLTLFGERPTELAPSICSPDLRMLRALDVVNAKFGLTQKDINHIGLLRHLKYVNIRYGNNKSSIYKLPRSIQKLQGLQTLDIGDSLIITLPSEISELRSLRTLRCRTERVYEYFDTKELLMCMLSVLSMPIICAPLFDDEDRSQILGEVRMSCFSRWSKSYGVKVPTGIGRLKELEILEVVDIKRSCRKAIKELGELVHLRKLKVVTLEATEQKCKILYEAIQKLSALQSLCIDAQGGLYTRTLKCMDSFSSPPPLLKTLRLGGSIGEMPDWIGNLMHLVKIYLFGSQLKEGTITEILGPLPNLMLLFLYQNSYVGEKLVFRAREFPNLRKLTIYEQNELREVKFEESASPLMERIEIQYCILKTGIIGIKLKEIVLGSKVARFGVLQGEVAAHGNHPVLRMNHDPSWHDLGDIEGSNAENEAAESLAEAVGESVQAVMLTTTNGSESGVEVESLPVHVAGESSQVVMLKTGVRESLDVEDDEEDLR